MHKQELSIDIYLVNFLQTLEQICSTQLHFLGFLLVIILLVNHHGVGS